AWADRFFHASLRGQIAIALSMVLIGPLVEELLFRGALFGPLAKRHPLSTVIVASAGMFAFVHLEPRIIPPIFLLGLAMGGLRAMSGSLLPSLLFHFAFNGTELVLG